MTWVCGWPWQWSSLEKAEALLFLNINWCISIKNTLGWSAVVCLWYKTIQFVVFYVATTVHKLDFKLLINETPNKWWLMKRRSWNDNRLIMFLTVSICFLQQDGFGGLVVSMLASGTQVCGFKPGRSRSIFMGMPSSGGEVKESVPCPSFAARKRT